MVVRQGSKWSPDLGAFYVEEIVVLLRRCAEGPALGNETVVCMFYAGDLIIFEEGPLVLQMMLDALAAECRWVGLKVNIEKTVHSVFFANALRTM